MCVCDYATLYWKYYHRITHTCMILKQYTEKSLVWIWTKANFLWLNFFWFIKMLSWSKCRFLVEFEYLCYYTMLSRSFSILYRRKTKLLQLKIRCIVYLGKYSGYIHRICVCVCIFVRNFVPSVRKYHGVLF